MKDPPKAQEVPLSRSTLILPALLALLAWPSPAAGAPRAAGKGARARLAGPWTVAMEGGISLVPVSVKEMRSMLVVAVSGLFWRRLDLELSFRYQVADLATHYDAALRPGARFDWGWFAMVAGLRVGYSVLEIHQHRGEVSSEALILNPALELRFLPWPWLELRVNAVTVTLYYNNLWIPCWEPTLGLGVRF